MCVATWEAHHLHEWMEVYIKAALEGIGCQFFDFS